MKLLTNISLRFLLFAAVLFLLSVPIFYLALQRIMLHSLDESLIQQKEQIVSELKTKPIKDFIAFNFNIRIVDTSAPSSIIRLSDKDIYIPSDKETVTHRALETIENVNGTHYYIYIQKSLVENEDLIQSIVALLSALLITLLAGAFGINYWASKKLWRPFYHSIQQLAGFQINQNKKLALSSSNISEFEVLNQSLQKLTENATSLYNAQKEFTENASHELQTPIAVLQAKTELLMQTSPLTDEQATLIHDVYNTGQRMAKLNRSLLMLSKVENKQYQLQDSIDIQKSLKDLLFLFEELAAHNRVKIITDFHNSFFIKAHKTLFDVMIGNLIKNAIYHSPELSEIQITIENNHIRFCNAAPQGGLNQTTLFKRFQKQNGEDKGLGLGLELSHKIATLFNASLTYMYVQQKHCFTLTFSSENRIT